MKKILLFGAFGQLGREWQTYLDDVGSKYIQIIPYGSDDLDITCRDCVKDEISEQQPDIIINCAAYTKVDQAEDEREKARRVNATAVKYLAKQCRQHDVKLVHFSTDYIFAGLKEDQARYPGGYTEDHLADPINWYGQTKWEGEQAIQKSGCRHLIVRVSWLCGQYGDNFVKTMLKLARSHSTIKVVNDQLGSPTFADHLVKTTWTLIEKEVEGTYHYSSNGVLSWADFAEGIFGNNAKDIIVQHIASSKYPTKAARPFYSKLKTKKIEQIEGIQTENWEAGLARLLKK